MTPRVLVVSEQRISVDDQDGLRHQLVSGTVNDLTAFGCTVSLLVRSDTPQVRHSEQALEVISLPTFVGLTGLFRSVFTLLRIVDKAVSGSTMVVVRTPGMVGMVASLVAIRRRIPYVTEVVGGFGPARLTRRENGVLAVGVFGVWKRLTRWQVRRSAGALYVTQRWLQREFPTDGISAAASDVKITPEWLRSPEQRVPWDGTGRARLLFVGSLEHHGKGLDLLFGAIASLMKQEVDCEAIVVASGRHEAEYRDLAQQLNLESRVIWRSAMSRSALHEAMLSAHVMVLPTRHEGLPRVLVEAMACSLPCVATDVGGIGELSDGCLLVQPESTADVTNALRALLLTPGAQASWSRDGFSVAQRYTIDKVSLARRKFWSRLLA
jgi:glycosyltransferase involved in cell wall biosynthesis